MNKFYRIETLFTDQWELIDPSASKLTKEECDQMLLYYVSEGINPNHLRAVHDN